MAALERHTCVFDICGGLRASVASHVITHTLHFCEGGGVRPHTRLRSNWRGVATALASATAARSSATAPPPLSTFIFILPPAPRSSVELEMMHTHMHTHVGQALVCGVAKCVVRTHPRAIPRAPPHARMRRAHRPRPEPHGEKQETQETQKRLLVSAVVSVGFCPILLVSLSVGNPFIRLDTRGSKTVKSELGRGEVVLNTPSRIIRILMMMNCTF